MTETPAPATVAAPDRSGLVRTGPMLAVLLIGQAMATMDGSIVAVAASTIRADLGASGAEQQLLLAAYTLAFAVLVVTGARLGQRYGHARIFRLGLAGFTAASLCCGVAPEPVTLLAARVGQGLTGALMVPQVLSMIHQHLSGPARSRAIGRYSMVLALGVAAGQILGGALITLDPAGLGWRAVFLVNVPIGVALLVVAGRFLPVEEPARTPSDRSDRLDLASVTMLGAAMAAIVSPLVLGRELGWPGWLWLLSFAVGAAGLAGFATRQRRMATRGGSPLLDLRVLTHPGVRSGLLACCLVMGGYAGLVFGLVLRLQDGTGYPPLLAGLAFVPYTVGFAVCGLLAPRLSGWPADRLPVAGPLLFAAAAGALALVSREDWPWVIASLLLCGAGAGHAAGFSPLVTRIAARIPADAGAALSALVSTGTLLASALGVAGLGGVYLSTSGPQDGNPTAGLGGTVAVLVVVLLVAATLAGHAVRNRRPDG
ncbi:MFS transporter [Plantactinospora sp. B5E13]|uniref:MFS transporter n=1 Tax=unclassified Plantactinospora TaxID=2631981 RepID=UPI00325C9759